MVQVIKFKSEAMSVTPVCWHWSKVCPAMCVLTTEQRIWATNKQNKESLLLYGIKHDSDGEKIRLRDLCSTCYNDHNSNHMFPRHKPEQLCVEVERCDEMGKTQRSGKSWVIESDYTLPTWFDCRLVLHIAMSCWELWKVGNLFSEKQSELTKKQGWPNFSSVLNLQGKVYRCPGFIGD